MELSQELSVTLGKLLSGSGHCSPRCGMKGWGPRNSRVPPILKSEDNPIGYRGPPWPADGGGGCESFISQKVAPR